MEATLAATASSTPAAERATCSVFIREYRHDCARRGGISWPLQLKEHTITSPEYLVSDDAHVTRQAWLPADAPGGVTMVAVPEGLFSFTWLHGTCPCGLAVWSGMGRLDVHG